MDRNLQLSFESFKRSAPAWIEKGKGLLISAKILNKELLSLCNKFSPNIPDEIYLRFSGLLDALLLLLGFSIENVIKAYIISNKPNYNNISELDQYYFNALGGHGIYTMVKKNIKILSKHESNLMQRLEQAITWAGRYNFPKSKNEKIKNIHPGFNENDFETTSILFEKIERLTLEKWENNEHLFYEWHDLYVSKLD